MSRLDSGRSVEEMANSNRPATEIRHVFRGTFIHSTHQAALLILEDALLGVDSEGKVRQIPNYFKTDLVGFRSIKIQWRMRLVARF